MRVIYILAVCTLPLTVWIAMSAYEQYEQANAVRDENNTTRQNLLSAETELAELEKMTDLLPAKFMRDAQSEFYTRTVEAGEVLGAGVRIEATGQTPTGKGMVFRPLRNGLSVASASVTAVAQAIAAPGLFSMLEDEIGSMPVTIRKATAKQMGDSVSLRLEVDVFGR
jgi:hypothetical protein